MLEFLKSLGVAEPLGLGFWSVALTFVAAAVFTWRFIPRVREFAIKVGWADMPNERRLNKAPLPNAGGLAIFAGFILPVLVVWALRPIGVVSVQIQVLAILLGAALLVLVGFIDDQFELPPSFRILVQTVCALLLIVNGLRIDLTTLSFWPEELLGMTGPLSVFVTWLWIVGITNAVNLMDGVDGVVGGIGFVGSMVMLAVAAQFPDRGAAVVLLAGLAGSTLAYLRYNFNPSRIIMGDAGATLIGFTLAAVALLGTTKLSASLSLAAPLLILALPILDTTQVVIGRLRRGVSPAQPDKTHIHHRLFSRFGARRASIIIWAITLAFCVVGMLLQSVQPIVVLAVVVVIAACLAWVAFRRVKALARELQETPQ